MALAHFQRAFTDTAGNVRPGISVTVRDESNGALAALCSDKAGTTPLANPLTTDEFGEVDFYAAVGDYRLAATGVDYRDVAVLTAASLNSAVADAETAAQAAALNADIYDDTTAGLAATVDGDYFSVPAADSEEYLELYRNDAGSATLIDSYPNKAAVDGKVDAGAVGSESVTTSTGTQTVADALDTRVISVLSIPNLLSLDVSLISDNQSFFVKGYNEGSSVGGGLFFWDSGGTESEDNVNIFGTFSSGRFKRVDRELSLDNAGADPDGLTASDDALDRVLSALPEVSGDTRTKTPVILGPGRYVFNSGSHTVTGEKGKFLQLVGQGFTATQIDYYGSEDYFLDIPSEFLEVSGIAIISRSASRDKIFLKQQLDDGRADIDTVFNNCLAVNWEYVHHCYGRGSTNNDCVLQGGPWTLIESPDPFTEGSASAIQSVKTGMRRYVSNGLSVDSAVAVFEFSENGPAAQYMNEVSITGVNGNTLSSLILGGYLSNVSIRTGALVRSLTLGAIRAKRINNLDMDISAVRGYDPDETPSSSTRIDYLILLETDGAVPTSDVMIDNVKISGVVGNLGNALIQCRGKVGNVTVSGLMLPNAFESSSVSGVSFIVGLDGIASGAKINIDGVSFSGISYDPATFSWVNSSIPDSSVNVGSYSAGNVPVPLKVASSGIATIPDSSSMVSFPHGLGFTPALSEIQITPLNDPANKGAHHWVSAVSSTNIQIMCSTAGAGTLDFAWRVDRKSL